MKAPLRPFLIALPVWAALAAAHAQPLGGRSSFAFLRQPANAPLAALGGVNASHADFDVNRWLSNPALLNKDMERHVSLGYVPYYGQVRHLSAVAAAKAGAGWAGGSLHYLDYGTFEETDAAGNVLGTFRAADYAATAAYARRREAFTLGAALRLAGSHLAEYSSYAVAADVGGLWKHPERDFTVGLVVRNAGLVLKRYVPGAPAAPLPLDVQLGATVKPRFMPLRFSITARHLNRPGAAFDDPALNTALDANGNPVRRRVGPADRVARHFTLGAEAVVAKAFYVRAGYNHLVRQEMRLPGGPFGAGFSFGFLLRLKALQLSYARFYQQAGGGVSYLTLSGNLGAAIARKAAPEPAPPPAER